MKVGDFVHYVPARIIFFNDVRFGVIDEIKKEVVILKITGRDGTWSKVPLNKIGISVGKNIIVEHQEYTLYYQEGLLHRTDGPAITYCGDFASSGAVISRYFLDGIEYTDVKVYKAEVLKIQLNESMEEIGLGGLL